MGESLKGKRVLVTGGAGFIGSHIVDRLVKIGAGVIVVDNLETGTCDNLSSSFDKIRFLEKDFCEEKVLDEALEGVDYICHQAALRSVPKSVSRPLQYHHTNVNGTLQLFLKAKERKIKKIVYASSSAVYGERDTFPELETDLPKPLSPYAVTKLIGEDYAYMFSRLYGTKVISLRYFNVFGPRQSLEDEYAVVVPKFITSLLEAKQPPIYGDGNQERDFTYVDNVVNANILALGNDDISGEVFNVAGGKPYSVNELFRLLSEIIKVNIDPIFLPPRPGDILKTCADISKTEKLLGWSVSVDFVEGLKRAVSWFRKNRPHTP